MSDLHHLRIFAMVAEKKSFSAAAEVFLLSQPTVSSHIRRLEDELGATLFHRLPREVELTPAGVILMRYAREILKLQSDAQQALREYAGRLTGDLFIGGSTIPGEYLIPPLLGEFRREAPEVRVTLHIADSRRIVEMVDGGQVELAVVGSLPGSGTLEAAPFIGDTLVVIAPPGHWLTDRSEPLRWEELAGEPFLLREPGSGTRETMAAAMADEDLAMDSLQVAGQLGSTEAVKQAVRGGVGIAVLSRLAVRHEEGCGALVVRRLAGKRAERMFHVIRHRHRAPSPAAAAFHACLLRHAVR